MPVHLFHFRIGRWRWLPIALLFAVFQPRLEAAEPARRPNIVLLMADDLGFSDLGCYGSEIQTPNLDRLAKEGLRFSQFYNCALCGPSRAALMTGQHPHRVGITNWTGLLTRNCVTLFELFSSAGYQTAAVGRLDMVTAETWHDPQMIARHVNRFLGSTGHQGPGNYFKEVRNTSFFQDGKPFAIPENGSYKTDLITDFAEKFISDAATRNEPFFLYMAHYAPHWPLHAKPEDIAKYRDLYRQTGWDETRQKRCQRLVDMGMIPADNQPAPRDPRVVPWSQAKHKDWEAERMAVFAAQIDSMDQSVGRIMETLRRTKTDTNTLVLFLSDNGASDKAVGNSLDRPGKTWRADNTPTKVGNDPSIQPGPADTFVTAGPQWAHVSNAPFRQHKQTNFEGGISSPLIAWWPTVIKTGNAISPELSHITDITATCIDVGQISYPAQFANRKIRSLDGKSLLPILRGQSRDGHSSLCWATSGCRAVRVGDWKLVAAKDGEWELYDLAKDRAELKNLAAQHPDRVATMAKVFNEWHRDTASAQSSNQE